MKKIFLLLIVLNLILIKFSFGQASNYNSNIWYFGKYAGINFNNGYPVSISGGKTNTIEGVATICDLNGNLLFYCDGSQVYNRYHQQMPNGSGLLGHTSASQSCIIVPDLNNNGLFFVFTVDAVENHLQNGLRYSIVDMSLDNGKGDIVPNQKNILLYSPVSAKITAILNSSENGYWIIAHEWGSNNFLSFKLNSSGLNTTPVVSSVGSIHNGGAYPTYPWHDGWMNAEGYMKANKNGSKLAVVRYRAELDICDFDRNTGHVNSCQTSPIIYDQNYGVEFSPNESKLYLSTVSSALGTTNYIYQFDLSQSNSLNNVQVLAHLTNGNEPSAIQVGPDGEVYVSEYNPTSDVPYLSKINNADLPLPYASYSSNAVSLTSGTSAKRGLPNLYYYKGFHFISEINQNQLDQNHQILFINPNNSSTLLFKNPYNEKTEVVIYDITGKIIYQFHLEEKEEVEKTFNLNKGLYLCTCQSTIHKTSQKFIIN